MDAKSDFIEKFKKRTKHFALESIRYYRTLPKTEEARIIGTQYLRSSTSTAANYRAVCRARSKAEFFAKLSVTIEEADESCLWLELLIESGIMDNNKTEKLLSDGKEIVSVLAKARKTVSNN